MYRNYLQSEHWRSFRKEILSKRKRCQNCGSKQRLNIHHKHYRTVGCETNADVIVLCQDCHLRLHRKPKWEKAKRARHTMDFTASTTHDRHIYAKTSVQRRCPRCAEMHSLFYKRRIDAVLVMAMACPNSKPRIQFIKYEPDLPIPVLSGR